jgi:TPR repeat protein
MVLKRIFYFLSILPSLLLPLLASGLLQYAATHMDKNPEIVRVYLENLESSHNNDVLIEVANFYLYPTPFYDISKVNKIFERIAKSNDSRGYKGLADSYLSGQGVALNRILAHVFYEKSARLNYGPGQFNAAILYRDGINGTKNKKRACYWLKKASTNESFELKDVASDISKNMNCLDIQ